MKKPEAVEHSLRGSEVNHSLVVGQGTEEEEIIRSLRKSTGDQAWTPLKAEDES